MRIFQPIVTGSLSVTGSVTATSFTGSLFGSSSYAFTASYALNAEGINTSALVTTASFNEYTGSTTSQFAGTASYAQTASVVLGSVTTALTASFATSFTVSSKLTINETLTDFAKIINSVPGFPNLFTQATGSYTSAIGKYTVYRDTNSRAGQFMTSWNGATISYTDVATVDIGSTSDVILQATLVNDDVLISAQTLSSGWDIKMLVTYI